MGTHTSNFKTQKAKLLNLEDGRPYALPSEMPELLSETLFQKHGVREWVGEER